MKIQKVFIQNINSIAEAVEIDFTQTVFQQSPLFAITGPTGSGKTSILDAIVLALYHSTPRVGKVTKTSIEQSNVVTIGKSSAYAKVQFQVKQSIYLASWMVEKNRNQRWNEPKYLLEILNPDTQEFESISGTEKSNGFETEIKSIIGLSSDQFLKSVLLAQGSFQEFLTAKEGERTAIIESLTGTQIYRDISKKTFDLHKAKQTTIKERELVLQTQAQQLLSEDILLEKQTEIQDYSSRIEFNKKTLESIQLQLDKIGLWEMIINLQTRLSTKTTNLNVLLSKQEVADAQRKAHEKAEKITPILDQKTIIETSYLSLETALGKAEMEYKTQQNQIEDYIKTLSTKYGAENVTEESFLEKLNLIFQELISTEYKIETLTQSVTDNSNRISKEQVQLASLKAENQTIQNEIQTQTDIEIEFQNFQKLNPYTNKIDEDLSQIRLLSEQLENDKLQYAKLDSAISKQSIQALLQIQKQKAESIPYTIEQAESALSKLKIESCNSQTVSTILSKLLEGNSIAKELQKEVKEQVNAELQIVTLNQKAKELQVQITEIQNTETRHKRELEESKSQFKHLLEADDSHVKNYRSKLQAGKSCMVCGSTEHPFTTDTSELEQFAKQKKHEMHLEEMIQTFTTQLSEFNSNYTSIQSRIQDKTQENQQKIQAVQNLWASLQAFPFWNTISFDSLDTQTAVFQDMYSKYQDLPTWYVQKQRIQDLTNLAKKESEILVKTEVYAKNAFFTHKTIDIQHLEAFKLEFQTKQTQALQAKSVLPVLQEKLQTTVSNIQLIQNTIDVLITELKVTNSKLESETTSLRTKIEANTSAKSKQSNIIQKWNELLKQSTEFKEQLASLNGQLNSKRKEKEQIQTKVETELKASNFSSIDECKAAILKKETLESYKQLQTSIDEEQGEIRAVTLQIEENKLKVLNTDRNCVEEKEQITNQKKQIEVDNRTLAELLGKLGEEIRKHEQNKAETLSLRTELDGLNSEFQYWNLLNKKIGSAQGDTFAKIAAAYTMAILIKLTNFHLGRLQSRYVLQMSEKEDNSSTEILIIDQHMGDEKRSAAKTLSGGESFLVSLCLALGLSDLSSQNIRLDSLFIDEGFGTLDPDTLNMVMEILENLSGTVNKHIGLISHVHELKERIPVQIKLVPDLNGHSKVILPI